MTSHQAEGVTMALEVAVSDQFGQRLRQIRKARKMTQQTLADAVGVPMQYISRYENGDRKPSLMILEWLCTALGITATELMGF